MKSLLTDRQQAYLIIFKNDATNLLSRVADRFHEYIEVFSLKRNRAVFRDIFDCRYLSATAFDLSHIPIETVEVLNQFHQKMEELFWYLKTTQDMPTTIEDEITRRLSKIEESYHSLILFINADLNGEKHSDLLLQGEHLSQSEQESFIPNEVAQDLLSDDE